MNLVEMRARLEEIVSRLDVLGNDTENLTEEIAVEINALGEEYDSIQSKVESLEKLEEIKAKADTSKGRKVQASTPKAPAKGVTVTGRHDKTGGFSDMGDFAMAVKNTANGNYDKRFQNTHHESSAEDGGFLIPSDFLTTIQKKISGDDSLLGKSRQFNVSGNHLSLPVDEVEPWNGGIQSYWIEEGGQYTESKHKFKQANFRLHKLGALVKTTDELLEDSVALGGYLNDQAPQSIIQKLNDAIISGDGVAKPSGIINSDFRHVVAKESGQTAATIVYENIIKMESRLLPNSNGVWIAHPAVKEQLRQLKDANGNHIYMNGAAFPNMAAKPFDMLLGRPVIYMMGSMPALGSEGDLILADMSYYYSVLKSGGMKRAVSTHLYFDRDLTAFKFTMRVDGGCPFSSPVTTQNGSYEMSGFVTLAERA